MVNAINGKTIFRVPGKQAATRFKGLKETFSIKTFEYGRRRLGPTITDMLNKVGENIKEINIDNAAKARLLIMEPALEERVKKGETLEQIFPSQGLSLFLTEEQILYILGNQLQINSIKVLAKDPPPPPKNLELLVAQARLLIEEIKNKYAFEQDSQEAELLRQISLSIQALPTARQSDNGLDFNAFCSIIIRNTEQLIKVVTLERIDTEVKKDITEKLTQICFAIDELLPEKSETLDPWQVIQKAPYSFSLVDKEFKAAPYTLKILDPNPERFTFQIEGAQIEKFYVTQKGRTVPDDNEIEAPIKAQIEKNGIKLYFLGEETALMDPNNKNVSWETIPTAATEFTAQSDGVESYTTAYKLTSLNLRQIIEALLSEIRRTQK